MRCERCGALALVLGFALLLAAAPARADIYVWVNAAGVTNYSDMPPPPGARITSVIRSSPSKPLSADAAAAREAAHQAEIVVLAERLRQLEREVELANRAPPPMQPVQYAPPPTTAWGCDPAWSDCGFGWGPSFVPGRVIVVSPGGFHHHFGHSQSFRGGHGGHGGFMRR